jgi:prepilin-type N-terminal cleavage/methylation domain-containing protein
MKLYSQPTNRVGNRQNKGFTLIEMIGVLAVIAILAAVLIPKVFEAINNARINNAAMACNSIKTGVADHYAKYGSIACDGTATPATPLTVAATGYNNYDGVLLREQLIDKLFATRLGDGTSGTTTGTRIVLLPPPAAPGGTVTAATTPTAAADAYFDLSGSGTNTISGSAVAVALITGVTLEDARALNRIIDGTAAPMGEGTAGQDLAGRVKYDFQGAATATVYVYLTHR